MDPKILIVSPVWLGDGIGESRFAEFFDGKTAVENSKRLAFWYEEAARLFDCEFFDAATVAHAGSVDCLHLEKESHETLAQALAQKVRTII